MGVTNGSPTRLGPCATIPQSPPSAPSAMCAPVAPAEGAICIRPHAHATQVLKQVSISAPMRCSPDSFGFSYSVRGGPAGEQRPVRNLFELAAEEHQWLQSCLERATPSCCVACFAAAAAVDTITTVAAFGKIIAGGFCLLVASHVSTNLAHRPHIGVSL